MEVTNLKRALISVHDKTGIVDFGKGLNKLGFSIISTGGTLKILKEGGIPNLNHISEVTGFPEMLDGRVKTVHPKILAGILAIRDNKAHMKDLKNFQLETVDLVACNLYPFEEATKKDASIETALENIDIGGSTLIRAAAKNFENVVVVVNPSKYMQILEEYKHNGDVTAKTRKILAIEAFKETSRYDSIIWEFLEKT
jgi:phosphoribosylaminoimidazolecarboxamide formyltransferase/IMP cyclohydrolase